MSLLNDVLRDLDARQGQGTQEVPAGLAAAAPTATGAGRLKPWLAVGGATLGVFAAIWWGLGRDSGAGHAGQAVQPSAQVEPSARMASSAPERDVNPVEPIADRPEPIQARSPEPASQSRAELASEVAEPVPEAPRQQAPDAAVGALPTRLAGGQVRPARAEPEVEKVLPTKAGQAEAVAVRQPVPTPVEQPVERPARTGQGAPAKVTVPAQRPQNVARLSKAPVRTPEQEALAIVRKADGLRANDPGQARRILEAGLVRLPGQTVIREALVRMHLASGELESARAIVMAAPAPVSTTLLGLRGWIEQQMGEAASSVATYSELVRREPENARWWSGLAIGLEQSGQPLQARRAWERVMALPDTDRRLLSWARQRLAALRAAES